MYCYLNRKMLNNLFDFNKFKCSRYYHKNIFTSLVKVSVILFELLSFLIATVMGPVRSFFLEEVLDLLSNQVAE